jgi:hypothetical protein
MDGCFNRETSVRVDRIGTRFLATGHKRSFLLTYSSLVAVVICLYTQERNILKTGRTHLRPYSENKYIDI